MSRQTSIQLKKATEKQVEDLKRLGFGTLTDIVRIAIDRMHQQETLDDAEYTEEEFANFSTWVETLYHDDRQMAQFNAWLLVRMKTLEERRKQRRMAQELKDLAGPKGEAAAIYLEALIAAGDAPVISPYK